MAIKEGDRLPEATLQELPVEYTAGCPTGPENRSIAELTKGKRIAIFAVPGAFTRTCSAKHLPGFVESADQLKGKKIDEIWCVSVNDAMVMARGARSTKRAPRFAMMADGSAKFTKALGLETDLTERGMGVRSQRYSMLVEDGVVEKLNLEKPGQYEVSSAENLLKQV